MKLCGECGREKIKARELCRRCYSRAWCAANRGLARAYCKAWYEANKERSKARSRAWYAANREKADARNRAWCAANRERHAATDSLEYFRNHDAYRDRNRRIWRIKKLGDIKPEFNEPNYDITSFVGSIY